ncbi:hypothetical protein [Bifidobacterium sp. ESL0790]|uniref:hypothetical protein n=1 Tax=Bifidobacterium sp. ESL0790 TaxID=2983233 RepID=UPI0023F85DD0|nr:hypothetical protein [Bifidobacterium sp. ESL0790]WEV72887.1 hypothetical protein OZY47_02710 [Bifidobacterium sp. ESL0790]
MRRTSRFDHLRRAAWAALCTVCVALAPMLGALVSMNAGDPSTSTTAVAYADEPSTQAVEPIDYKPKLYKMLGYNKQIDTDYDQLRMDFVLRVAHGQINPDSPENCASGVSGSGRSCGLQIKYNYHALPGETATKLDYLNTQAGGLATAVGAALWANNKDEKYTIHSMMNNGAYDYLSISIEANIDYSDTPSKTVLGGVTTPQYVFAQVKEPGQSAFNNDQTDSPYVTNIAANYPAKLYNGSCDSSGCNGPRAFVGYNTTPLLTGSGQANWGMVTDNGLAIGSFSLGDGWAPPKTFFTYWYNPSGSYGCSRVSSYYFQWFGLKNGKDWVPVSDLTPHAQSVTQVARNGDPTTPLLGVNTNGAFNAPDLPNRHIISLQGPLGSPSPAQLADGSINFKKAKETQNLDGYFKLVTWPVTTNQPGYSTDCSTAANKSVYNPLADYPNGVLEGMTSEEINSIMDTGWTIDTVYYKYTLPVVEPPVITTPTNNSYSPTVHPTISGTGEPGHIVYLYAEDPSKPILPGNPDDPDTRGRYVGEATVDENGNWSIVDNDNAVTDGQVRYHAWQTEQETGSEIASIFSNIQTVKFGVDAAPVVSPAVTVPHTKRAENGQLEPGAMVHITGTADPLLPGDTLKVYASHATAANIATVASTPPDESDLMGECTQTLTAAGSQGWSCDVSPSFFLSETAEGETYLFRAKLVNSSGVESGLSTGTTLVTVDMTPPQLAISPSSNNQTISGTAYRLTPGSDPEAGVTILVVWPDGTTGTTTVQTDGTWSINVPPGMTTSGQVKIAADDTETNESGWLYYELTVPAPAKDLPMTGDWSKLPWIIAGVVLLLMAIGTGVSMVVERSSEHGKAVDDP